MSKASNFTDLIQRVAASCLLHPLGAVRQESVRNGAGEEEEVYEYEYESDAEEEVEEVEEEEAVKKSSGEKYYKVREGTKEVEMEMIMNQVFDVVSVMKKAYLSLQEAHCPWDPEKMRVADAAVLSELRKIGVLRERFRRSCGGGGRGRGGGASAMAAVATLREVVAPYEAAVEELKREVKAKELEVENLKGKLKSVTSVNDNSGKKGRSVSRRKVGCSLGQGSAS